MKDIEDKLARVGELVAGWEACGSASELERDLALEMLREVYAAIKFAPTDHRHGTGVVMPAPVAETTDTPAPAAETSACADSGTTEAEDCPTVEDAVLAAQEPDPQEPAVAEEGPAAEIEEQIAETDDIAQDGEDCQMIEEPAVAEEKSDPEDHRTDEEAEITAKKDVAEAEDEPLSHPASGEEPAAETEEPAAEIEEPAAEKVVVRESPLSQRLVAPEVIRSLYGTDTDDIAPAQRPATESVIEHRVKSAPEPVQKTKPEKEPKAEPSPRPAHAATLGEAMAARRRTLGETLRGGGERDMASRIAAAERPGLKRSIGLNDRFLMIRDMFDGDAAAFDRAIARLDTFTDLDEAVIWIHDNFDWSADSRGATLLVGLLERKLGR